MNIDINEFAAAKAIFFLNPDADDLSADVRNPIADTRSSLTNALYRYMVRRRGNEEAADRFGKLLLLGTVIATIAVEAKEAVVVADFFEQIQFSSFAKQLLFGLQSDEETMDTSSAYHMTSTTVVSSPPLQPQTTIPSPIPDLKHQMMTSLAQTQMHYPGDHQQQQLLYQQQMQQYMQQQQHHQQIQYPHPTHHQMNADARGVLKINGFSPP
uniref:NR LBD domain-containing protein n=1 Tax=Ditylenchus dipsaci TaxID=166011 RepID=A0A915DXT0_9BILA